MGVQPMEHVSRVAQHHSLLLELVIHDAIGPLSGKRIASRISLDPLPQYTCDTCPRSTCTTPVLGILARFHGAKSLAEHICTIAAKREKRACQFTPKPSKNAHQSETKKWARSASYYSKFPPPQKKQHIVEA